MSKEAVERLTRLTASSKREQANKKAVKKLDKRSKMTPKKQVKAAHDKIESQLDKIAKKHGVKIKLNRNKAKLPSVVVSGIKSMKYGDAVEVFKAIPNSSPVPQKMSNSGALFRLFTKRKVTASETSKFVVTAQKNGKRYYWTDEGFRVVAANKAAQLGEESADKVQRRSEAKGWASKTVPATMTASSVPDDAKTYTLKVNDGDGSLKNALEYLKKCGDIGHSVSFKIDDENFDFDGDGADKIYEIKADESYENEDVEDRSGDDYNDASNDTDTNNIDDEGESDEEAEANKANMVKFISDNNVSRESLFPLADRASKEYMDDLKNNGPVDDLIGFIYDILGAEDAKTGLKSIINKKSM